MTQSKLLSGDTLNLFLVNTITALAYSFVLPIMSLFLIKHLQAPPALIGLFTVTAAVLSIGTNQLAGRWIDRGVNAKVLFCWAILTLIATGLFFSQVTSFWLTVIIGAPMFATGNTCIPILFAMIRQHADRSGLNSTNLNAQMRSGVSFIWIAGPAITFTMVGWVGFSWTYLISAGIATIALVFAIIRLPDFIKPKPTTKHADGQHQKVSLRFWALGAVILLGNMANGLYITAMPLIVTESLGLAETLAGLMMGVTAAIEIPAMLLAPKWSHRFRPLIVLTFGFCVAVVFYCVALLTTSYIAFIALQLLNGLFYGIFVGLGISIIQDAMPELPGFASAFYTNAMRVGSMMGSTTAGLLAQGFGFRLSLSGSLAAVSIALLLLLVLVKFKPKPRQHEAIEL